MVKLDLSSYKDTLSNKYEWIGYNIIQFHIGYKYSRIGGKYAEVPIQVTKNTAEYREYQIILSVDRRIEDPNLDT